MNNLFEDVGSKIKVIAKVIFWVGIVGSAILFLSALFSDNAGAIKLVYLLTGIITGLMSYVGSLYILAFGEIVESLQINNHRMSRIETAISISTRDTKKQLDDIDAKIKKLNNFFESEEDNKG